MTDELLKLILAELKNVTAELKQLNSQTRMLVYRELPKSGAH